MRRKVFSTATALILCAFLPGCVAAAIPLAMGGVIAKKEVDKNSGQPRTRGVQPPSFDEPLPAAEAPTPPLIAVPVAAPVERKAAAPVPVQPEVVDTPGEGIIPVAGTEPAKPMPTGNFGAYAPLVGFASSISSDRSGGLKEKSVVLMPAKSLDAPNFTVCEGLPSAVLVDLDFNGGLERDAAMGRTPNGAKDAFNSLRDSGVKVIFMASVPEARAAVLSEALDIAGFGPAVHGDTLWLVGDRGSYNKDSLRWKIASRNCIIAQAGDAPGDFSMLMGDRERVDAPDVPPLVAQLGNAGWFVVPSLLTAMPSGSAQ